jgi:proline iminopeptidase
MNILYYILTALIVINLFIFNYLYTYKKTFYPEIEPFKETTIQVSNLHTIYYAEYGNKNGKPVLFLHGGPGYAPLKETPRFFNPNAYHVIILHQRGCGKSTPLGEIKENTTQDLIEDCEKIRKQLNIKKWMLFGGSWGSTLSLAYSITYPEVITGLILRGIFLGRKEEINWMYSSIGAANVFPESWDYFKNALPYKTTDYINEYDKCFNGDFENKRDDCLLAWTVWENSIISLYPKPLNTIIKETLEDNEYKSGSLIEHHYMINNCFLDQDFFFKQENINKIKDIPIIIVQGRYDMICPVVTAYNLHKALPKSILNITMAGHSSLDEETVNALINASDSFI